MKTITDRGQLAQLPVNNRSNYYFDEVLTTSWPIRDNGELLISVEELARKKGIEIILEPAAGEASATLLREQCARQLLRAAHKITKTSNRQLILKITGSFRPLALQRKYFEQIKKEIASREGLTGRQLWQRVTQFIAAPDLYPPHTTGGAIDCTIVRKVGHDNFPMGTPINSISDRAQTWHPNLSCAEKENRQTLYQTMIGAGFSNLATEWWHYSYGDQYWAVCNNRPYALYDKITS